MTPIEWLLSGDTGISSKTILSVMTGSAMSGPFRPDIPYDPSDFGRCYRLLQKFPEWRERLPEVAATYPIWGPMVAAWDELTKLYEQELENEDGKAPMLYARMKTLVDEGRLAAGFVRTGPYSWQGPQVEEVGLGNGASLRFSR